MNNLSKLSLALLVWIAFSLIACRQPTKKLSVDINALDSSSKEKLLLYGETNFFDTGSRCILYERFDYGNGPTIYKISEKDSICTYEIKRMIINKSSSFIDDKVRSDHFTIISSKSVSQIIYKDTACYKILGLFDSVSKTLAQRPERESIDDGITNLYTNNNNTWRKFYLFGRKKSFLDSVIIYKFYNLFPESVGR